MKIRDTSLRVVDPRVERALREYARAHNLLVDEVAAVTGVSDGDKGDITVSGSGATWTIDNDAVTYAKLQNVSATSRILGRKTASAGNAEECTLSEVLDFIGSAAQGDILYRDASGWARLGAGTSGHFLKTNGTGANPAWAAASAAAAYVGCRAYNDGTQSIPNNSSTAVTFNTDEWDTDAIHDTGSNTSRFTVPSGKAGKWSFTWKVGFASNTTGNRVVFLRKNGGTDSNNVIGSSIEFTPPSTIHLQGSSSVDLAVGDYIELFIYQNSGGGLDIGSAIASNRGTATAMEARFLG